MGKYLYDEDPLLSACGISIEKQLMKFDGRVLKAPKVPFVTLVKQNLSAFIHTFTSHFNADCS